MAGAFTPPIAPAPGANFGYTDPTRPPPNVDGGNWAWDAAKGVWNFIKGNAGDILGAAGSAIEGYMSSADRAKALAEQKAEFEAQLKQRQAEAAQSAGQYGRTTGDSEAQAAVRAQTQLNTAPIADKAQALILARMGVSPGAFKPRDYTQSLSGLAKPNTAPGAAVATTMQNAASSYKPGQGGVNTDVLKALIAKLTGSSGITPPSTGPIDPTGTTMKPPVDPNSNPIMPIDKGPVNPTTFKFGDGDGNDTEGTTDVDTDPADILKRKLVGAY